MHINPSSGMPLYLQLKNQLRRAIAGGVLRAGDRLPAVRDLAAEAVVNPNTIARVYRELEAEGLLASQRGVGTFVASGAGKGRGSAERDRLLDAAAARFLTEAAQLGLSAKEAAAYLVQKAGAKTGKPPAQGDEDSGAAGDQNARPE